MAKERPVGVLTGLASEARLVEELAQHLSGDCPPPKVRCAAASARRATELSEELCQEGVGGLLSFGIAGGLDPRLAPGHIILAQSIVTAEGEALACDASWHGRVLQRAAETGIGLEGAPLAGVTLALSSPGMKKDLFTASSAAAVDMESLALARAASAAGLPFLALRAVADPAQRGLPSAALAPLTSDGRPQPHLVAGRLALRPWQLPALMRLASDARRAERSLAKLPSLTQELFGGL